MQKTRGRPKGPPSYPVSIRLSEQQKAAYLDRGGARWIKRLINEEIERQQFKKKAQRITVWNLNHDD